MSVPTYGSLFAGIGGFCLGLERAGMRAAWRVEIEKNCCRVLSRHWPADPLHKDVKEFRYADGTVRPDVICGGFPCQDVSVAGRRAGLAGARSGLWWEFARVIEEFRPKVVLIENVPGLLSSNRGRDMGAVVGTLGGMGFGVAWRVLDAQWFGLAQRRKRLFIVGCAGGDVRGAGEVLFESSSLPGDSEPSREALKIAARAAAAGVGGDRSGVVAEPLADPICTREGKTWTCEGRNNFRARNLVFTKARRAQSVNDHETWVPADGGVAPTQNQFDNGDTRATTVVAFANRSRGGVKVPEVMKDGISPALTNPGSGGRADAVNVVVTGGGTWWDGGDVSQTLDTVLLDKQQTMPEKNRFPAVLPASQGGPLVRRLTPVECERLQGFPDGWTALGGDGSPLSDSARYRALGNAVAVPVAEWLGRRIVASGRVGAP